MADKVRGVEYYYVTVPDAPGEGQRTLSALKKRGVNLLAYLGFPLGGGRSQIDLVPEDPESLKEAAQQAGITLSDAKRALLIQGDDRVGAVADIMVKLAEANINVTAAAAAGAGSGRYGMILWVAQADYGRAADALGAQRYFACFGHLQQFDKLITDSGLDEVAARRLQDGGLEVLAA